MTAWGRTLISALALNSHERETPLMRMFRVEYAREYRQLKRLGCDFNDSTIRAYIESNR